MRRLIAEIIDPLCHNGKLHAPLLALFLVINALVLVNAVLHDPAKGYDAGDHLHYIRTLAEDRRIPTCADSAQCYIPPLAYMMPAILLSTGKLTLLQAAKAAQLGNVLISAALLYVLLKICRLLLPNSIVLRISVLAMLGILPVYYKTLSLIRGEVYLPLLVSLIAYLVLRIFAVGQTNTANFILLGILIGLAILARQWGLLVLPAILLFIGYVSIKDHAMIPAALRAGLACLIIPALVAGWYYLIMYHRYGSLTAWDRPASHLSLTALPASFYFGLGSGKLFTDPIRPSFSNQFPAIFYSDTWGDYSAYFLVYIKDKVTGDYQTGKDLERLIKSGKPLAAN
ncbi:MAG TPA: hypothetical protein VMJ64_02040, partial [Anaerolineales bacterium]|nr:hypothetical protein [Anaerolineales bacterium]